METSFKIRKVPLFSISNFTLLVIGLRLFLFEAFSNSLRTAPYCILRVYANVSNPNQLKRNFLYYTHLLQRRLASFEMFEHDWSIPTRDHFPRCYTLNAKVYQMTQLMHSMVI